MISTKFGIIICVVGILVALATFMQWLDSSFQWAGYIAIVLGAIIIFAAMKQQQ